MGRRRVIEYPYDDAEQSVCAKCGAPERPENLHGYTNKKHLGCMTNTELKEYTRKRWGVCAVCQLCIYEEPAFFGPDEDKHMKCCLEKFVEDEFGVCDICGQAQENNYALFGEKFGSHYSCTASL
jgi:hypothetical protein